MKGKKQTKASAETRCCCKKHAVCTRLAKKTTARSKVAKKTMAKKTMAKKAVATKAVARKTVARKNTPKTTVSEKRMKDSAAKTAGPLVLEERIGIQDVTRLAGRLQTLLKSDSELVIDANAVKSADISSLQILVAFANSARAQSSSVNWKCDEGSLRQLAKLADLEHYLEFDATPAAAEDDGMCPVF